MDRKTFSIIMAIALIVGFFLPLFKGGSALDIVKSGGDWQNYLWGYFPNLRFTAFIGRIK